MTHTLNIISLPHRIDRREALIPQLLREKITFQFWDGIKDHVTFRGCSLAHKAVIRAAKERGDDFVAVAEDDLVICEGAWQYFIDSIPDDFDMFFGSVSNGYNSADGYCRDYRGNFMYICHSRFYDRFLSVTDMAHLDVSLSELKDTKFKIIDEFCGFHADGISSQDHKFKTYQHLWEGRKFYNNGNS